MSDNAVADFFGRIAGSDPVDTSEVKPAWREKIDPDEPWRYVCPDCGSPSVTRLVGGKAGYGKTYKCVNRGLDAEKDRQAGYSCRPCGERKQVVYDKKEGKEVDP